MSRPTLAVLAAALALAGCGAYVAGLPVVTSWTQGLILFLVAAVVALLLRPRRTPAHEHGGPAHAAIDYLPAVWFDCDREGIIGCSEGGLLDALGFRLGQPSGHPYERFLEDGPDDERARAAFAAVYAERSVERFVYHIQTGPGRGLHLDVTLGPLPDGGVWGCAYDVTTYARSAAADAQAAADLRNRLAVAESSLALQREQASNERRMRHTVDALMAHGALAAAPTPESL